MLLKAYMNSLKQADRQHVFRLSVREGALIIVMLKYWSHVLDRGRNRRGQGSYHSTGSRRLIQRKLYEKS